MKTDKIYSLMGFALRARNARVGNFGTMKAINSGEAKVVLLASDAAENTKDKIVSLCNYRNVPLITLGTKEEISKYTNRSETVCVAVTDKNISNGILNNVNGGA